MRQSGLENDPALLQATSGWDTQREAQIHATKEAARRVEEKKAAAQRRYEAGEPEETPEEKQAKRQAERARRKKEAASERCRQLLPAKSVDDYCLRKGFQRKKTLPAKCDERHCQRNVSIVTAID